MPQEIIQVDLPIFESNNIKFNLLSVSLPDETNFDEWLDGFCKVNRAQKCSCFWIGDLLVFSDSHNFDIRNEQRFIKALAEFELSAETLSACKWVAKKIAPALRCHDLSWGHHQVLAALDEDKMKLWMDWAAQNKATVEQLRIAVRADKSPNSTIIKKVEKYQNEQKPPEVVPTVKFGDALKHMTIIGDINPRIQSLIECAKGRLSAIHDAEKRQTFIKDFDPLLNKFEELIDLIA